MKTNRNGALSFWAFVFCMIFVVHYSCFLNPAKAATSAFFFFRGELAIDFFFIAAGAMLAKSVNAVPEGRVFAWSEYRGFLKGKLRRYLPGLVICWIASFAVLNAVLWTDLRTMISNFFTALTELLPIRAAGFNPALSDHSAIVGYRVMDQVWAISAVFLALAILYPLYRRNRQRFEYYIAPVGALLLLSFLFFKTQKLAGDDLLLLDAKTKGLYFSTIGCLKAPGEMLAGVVGYVLARHFREKTPSRAASHLLSALELCCYLAAIAYMQFMLKFDLPQRFDFLAAGAIFFGVTLSLSGKSSLSRLCDNKFFDFLGRFSLYPFLTFMLFAKTLPYFLPDLGERKLTLVYIALTLLSALIVMALEKPFVKLVKASKRLLVKPAPPEKEAA